MSETQRPEWMDAGDLPRSLESEAELLAKFEEKIRQAEGNTPQSRERADTPPVERCRHGVWAGDHCFQCGDVVPKILIPCPNAAHMGEFACTDKSQCWEPCGELGNDDRYVRRAPPHVTDEMVNRFLSWSLPDSVCSDQIVTERGARHRIGTNLLTADEARAMLEHVLATGSAPKVGDQEVKP